MNTNLLKSQIVLNNMSVEDVVEKLDISKSAYYRKLKGNTEFTRKEINSLIKLLNLDVNLAMKIFFDDKVS